MICDLLFRKAAIKKNQGPKHRACPSNKFGSLGAGALFLLNFWALHIGQLIDVTA